MEMNDKENSENIKKEQILKRTTLIQENEKSKKKSDSSLETTKEEKPILNIKENSSNDLGKNATLANSDISLNDMIKIALTKEIDINSLMIKSNFSDNELLKKGFSLYNAEKILLLGKGFFGIIENSTVGIMILTQYRFVFKFLYEKTEKKMNFSNDFFKIPYILITKIEKKPYREPNIISIIISVRDGRNIQIYIIGENQNKFLEELQNKSFPLKFDLFSFPKDFNDDLKREKEEFNGWKIYDMYNEYKRQGINFQDEKFPLRLSHINSNYKLIPTYPDRIVIPRIIKDEELIEASKYRTNNRLPTLSYLYKLKDSNKFSGIWRSSQFKGGLMGGNKSDDDVKLIHSIENLGIGELIIYDARPYINALANRVNGGGFENVENYSNVILKFCQIENIHKARDSMDNLRNISNNKNIMFDKNFWSKIEQTLWLDFIMNLLKFAHEISEKVKNGNNVLIHCSDGWDRTPQLVTLSQILLEPYYRTLIGFAVLIEKDWLSFGHPFAKRSGISENKEENENERSPIFIQFLDCVHQLLMQYPNSFQFNDEYLIFIALHYNLNLFGTFMFDNEKERIDKDARYNTPSLWTFIFKNKDKYINPFYDENSQRVIKPNYGYYNIKLWYNYYLRYNYNIFNNTFALKENDKKIYFYDSESYYNYVKKEEDKKIKKYKNALSEVYSVLKDNEELFNQLSSETKKLLENPNALNKPKSIFSNLTEK